MGLGTGLSWSIGGKLGRGCNVERRGQVGVRECCGVSWMGLGVKALGIRSMLTSRSRTCNMGQTFPGATHPRATKHSVPMPLGFQ